MVVSAHAVANEIIALADNDGKPLTNMQLQKLVFLSHGYTLALLEHPLYYDDTYAWQWGPVIRSLYKSLQKYGRGVVKKPLDAEAEDKLPSDGAEMEIIEAVWEGYGHLSGGQLSTITHKRNTPWSRTWDSDPFGIIPKSLIAKHYKGIIGES